MRAALVSLVIVGLCAGIMSLIVLAGRAGGAEPVTITAQDLADPAVAPNDPAVDDEATEPVADEDDSADPTQSDDETDAESDPSPQPTLVPEKEEPVSEAPAPETPAEGPEASPTAAPEPTTSQEPTPAPTATPESGPVDDFPPGAELPDVGGLGQLPPPPVFPEVPTPVPPAPVVPTPEPPLPPQPTVLDVIPPTEAVPTAEPEPDPPVSLGPVAQGAPGGLTGNEFGCKSDCIISALLKKNIHNADLEFEIKTNVATTNLVWVLPPGPVVVNGVPAHQGQVPRAVNADSNNEWNTTLLGLEHDTTYRVVITATDNQGNYNFATTLVTTTSEPVDQLVANGSPCDYECITHGLVTPGPTFDLASVAIETNTDVTFQVAISTSEPGTIGGNPFLPSDVTLIDVVANGTSYSATAMGLAPETTYYIVARVTDNEGAVQYATGSFVSMAAPVIPEPQPLPEPEIRQVVTWIDRFHIHQDGDSVGKGEIAFEYGTRQIDEPGSDYLWYLPFQKLDAGTSVDAGGFRISALQEGQEIPPIIVNAREADAVNPCLVEVGSSLTLHSAYNESCKEALTAAHLSGVTLEWIENLPTCDGYAVALANSTDRCHVIKSSNPGDDFVIFDALVVFRVI